MSAARGATSHVPFERRGHGRVAHTCSQPTDTVSYTYLLTEIYGVYS